MNTLEHPSYLYLIECVELGLVYVGTRKQRDFTVDTKYMGSSWLLDNLRTEFKEHQFDKHLLHTYSFYTDCIGAETELILHLRDTTPSHLVNLSANNSADFWQFDPSHLTGSAYDRALKSATRHNGVELFVGQGKNFVITKREDGTAHIPGMPSMDMTPIPGKKTWNGEMLDLYRSLPAGHYHFYSVIDRTNHRCRRYLPVALVEEFASEQEARLMSSKLARLTRTEYDGYVMARI